MQYLYRAFNEKGTLLYVGISGRWSERLHQHEKTSDWMEETDHVKIERFKTRSEVEDAEKKAILHEKPKYNKRFNLKYESTQDHFQKLKFWLYFDTVPDDHHEALVYSMRGLLEEYPFDYSRRQSRYVADIFREVMDYIDSNQNVDWECRNCRAIRNHGMFMGWADDVAKQWEAYYDDNE